MIRSSKHSLKFTNKTKLKTIKKFIGQYKSMVNKYINIIWNEFKHKIPNLLNNDICQRITTNNEFDSRIRQCAAKQACSMCGAVLDKHNKRIYVINQLRKEGKDTSYLQRKTNLFQPRKPKYKDISVELDSRFINYSTDSSFDLFIQIFQIGNKEKIRIPVRHTKSSNKWLKKGKLKQSIRLINNEICLFYEIPDKEKVGEKIVGADQGLTTCLSLSDKQVTKTNKHGHDLTSITKKLCNRKKGSKGFRRTQEHRKNYINWSINQLNFDNVKELKLEKIYNLRKGKSTSKYLSHWTYTLIKNKLVGLSEDKGFIFTEQDNKFMSQRCNQCGWTHKLNRSGKTFKCKNINCNFVADSDLNAASNHETELIELPKSVWYNHLNRSTGFYWLNDRVENCNHELIVRDVQKSNGIISNY